MLFRVETEPKKPASRDNYGNAMLASNPAVIPVMPPAICSECRGQVNHRSVTLGTHQHASDLNVTCPFSSGYHNMVFLIYCLNQVNQFITNNVMLTIVT